MFEHPVLQRDFTPAHKRFREHATRYFAEMRLKDWLLPGEGFLRKSIWEEFGRQGFLGLSLPREVGGQGLGPLGSLIINEALSQLDDVGLSLGMHIQNEITAYWLFSTQQTELRQKYLPEMLKGRLVGCTCDTELNGRLESTAVRDGNDLVITGTKAYIVTAYNADLCFVSLMLDGEAATVVVERERPGVRIAKIFDKFGSRSIDSTIVEFNEVRVPHTNVVSQRGVQRLIHWNMVMTRARFLISADACFIHRIALRRILEYGNRRLIGDRPLARWPVNRHALARAQADAVLMWQGIVDVYQNLGNKHYPVAEAAAVKWFCVDRALQFTALCVEFEGGAGYMLDSPFLTAHAQVRGLTMAGGTPTTMKVIANGALACKEEIDAMRD